MYHTNRFQRLIIQFGNSVHFTTNNTITCTYCRKNILNIPIYIHFPILILSFSSFYLYSIFCYCLYFSVYLGKPLWYFQYTYCVQNAYEFEWPLSLCRMQPGMQSIFLSFLAYFYRIYEFVHRFQQCHYFVF